MFATLLGDLPRPPLPAAATPDEVLETVIRAQEQAGLEPITDGGFGIGETPVARWTRTAALTGRLVKQVVLGPYSAAHGSVEGTLAAAGRLQSELLALVAAGCPMIEVHEPEATKIGPDETGPTLFREAHRRLLDGVDGTHLSLAITGGNADAAGLDTLLTAPYASLALDLIAGPDNWRLIASTPGDRGIVCGALSPERDADDRVEVLLWAAGYAASTGGRGARRVGLASASSLAGLPWEVALRKLAILGEAARLVGLPAAERRKRLDPRAVDLRSAALGRVMPPMKVRRRPARPPGRPPDRA
jgi:methionine synthase II (cobalamin-independent)